MNSDKDSHDAKNKGETRTENASSNFTNPTAAAPEIKPAQAAKPPAAPPENLSRNETTREGEHKKDRHKEISVKLVQTNLMTDFERRSFRLSVFTLLVLIGTFVVFDLQLRESRTQTAVFKSQVEQARTDAIATHAQAEQQIKAAKDQLVVEERPYMWLQDRPKDDPGGMIGRDSDGRLIWNIYYANFGKTPAIRFCREVHMVTGKDAIGKVVDIAHDTCTFPAGSIIPPGTVGLTTAYAKGKPTDTRYRNGKRYNLA